MQKNKEEYYEQILAQIGQPGSTSWLNKINFLKISSKSEQFPLNLIFQL